MPRTLKIAAVQMDAAPAPKTERLARAETLVAQAAASGAQLVVLPELFNSGYTYSPDNYHLPETIDGPTAQWMKQQAAAHGVHLAGSFLLLDSDEVYNTMLLVAPDGRAWRYDKSYPYIWERAYFREGRGVTVAETDLGRLGLLICWDSAHADLWARYAGQVDAMVITSCPPAMHRLAFAFPDGERIAQSELGGVANGISSDDPVFGADLDRRAAWMGVPLVHSTGGGQFRSRMPAALPSLLMFLAFRPDLWGRLAEAEQTEVVADYFRQTKIVDGAGRALARVISDGDAFTLAEVELADAPPMPQGPQPQTSVAPLVLFLADYAPLPFLTAVYREGLRRVWGARMAPWDQRTLVWMGLAAAAFAFGWLMGRGRR